MKTVTLPDGYSRRNKIEQKTFRVITLDEVKAWAVRQEFECNHHVPVNEVPTELIGLCECKTMAYHAVSCNLFKCGCGGSGKYYRDITPSRIWFHSQDGRARQAKINGKVKTWKRDPNRVEIPLKYGLYEHYTVTERDIENGMLLEPYTDQ